MRLDQAIALRFEVSRRKARELIAAGRVLVNQRQVRVASREVAGDDELRIAEERPPVPLLKLTDDWVAVDKPAGVPTQPPRDRSAMSLEEMLRVEYREIYLVHRLDTPTSGVVVFARNRGAAARLSALFASRAIRKTYLALVTPGVSEGLGRPGGADDRAAHPARPLALARGDSITIDTPIDGKEAITIVRPRDETLVEAEILTGRTHQIRIHLASIGHPVDGDRRYGGAPAPRLMLHAWKLEHEELGTIEAPVPKGFGTAFANGSADPSLRSG
jgi:RluA family pseudouridine synthase